MAKTDNSTDSVASVKDGLRRARFEIRRRAHGVRETGSPASLFPQPLALAADAVLSAVEAAATGLRAPKARVSENLTFPRTLSAYFKPFGASIDDESGFAVELYYATKALLRRFGAHEFLVSESAFETVRDRVEAQFGEPAPARLTDADICGACARLAVEMLAVRPVRQVALGADVRPRNLMLSPNAYCAFVIALAIAVKTRDPRADPDAILVAADLSVDACFGPLMEAARSRDAGPALERELRALLPHLP